MCGRYAVILKGEVLDLPFVEESEFPQLELPFIHYNICPGTVAPILDNRGCLRLALWGLVPSGSGPAPKRPLFNARSETASQRGGFRNAWLSQRCVVPAVGFYEWTGPKGSARIPYFVPPLLGSDDVLWLAGLASTWRDPAGTPRWTYAVLTESSQGSPVEALHDRIPVSLPKDAVPAWLKSTGDLPTARQAFGRPYQVDSKVNAAANNDPSNLRPVES